MMRFASCPDCRFYVNGRCEALLRPQRMRALIKLDASESCPYDWPRGPSICDDCVHLQPDGGCRKFRAGCDAEMRRMAVVRAGLCRFHEAIIRSDDRYSGPRLRQDTFITVSDLTAMALELARVIPVSRFDYIIAVSRSGLLPGSVIATLWHKPLMIASPVRRGLVDPGHGWRLSGGRMEYGNGPALLVDDTAAYGNTLRTVVDNLRTVVDVRQIKVAVCYAAEEALTVCDYVGAVLPRPHYLQWCIMNTGWITAFAFDMDGVICDDPHCFDEAPEYQEFVRNARPRLLPLRHPATIVTARHETVRAETMAWLNRHGVRVSRLIMWEGAPRERWLQPDTVARWKANVLRTLASEGVHGYVESDVFQAEVIAHEAKIPVVCPSARRVFNAELHEWWRADQ